jgi:tetratricopeptide (TPR) repeat protein
VAFDKAQAFLDKGLSYSTEIGNKGYEAIAHTRKAMLLKKRGDYNNALQQTILAITSAEHNANDSLKSWIYIEMGDIFLMKRDFISAYKNYNLAFDLADGLNNIALQSEVYQHLANLYLSLSDEEEAKKNLLKSLDLNTRSGNKEGLMKNYFDLARMSDQTDYIEKLLELAEKENSTFYLFQGHRLMFFHIMVVKKDSKKALAYLEGNEGLNQSYLNTGAANYYWNIGNIFKYAGEADSAIRYFNLGKAVLEKTVDASIAQDMNTDIGECYADLKQSNKAIECFKKP